MVVDLADVAARVAEAASGAVDERFGGSSATKRRAAVAMN
jgi:hypothetical protein